MSREPTSGRTHNSVRPPPSGPPPLPPSDFPLGWPQCEGECRGRCDGAAWRNFSIGVDGQVLTVREQRSKRDAMAAPRAAWGIGTPYNGKFGGVRRVGAGGNRYAIQRSRRWMSRADVRVGPKILFDRPGRDPHPVLHQISPVGWPLVKASAEGGAMRRCGGNFSIGAGGRVLTVREQQSKRDAMAAPRAAWESVQRTTEMRWRSAGRRGWESESIIRNGLAGNTVKHRLRTTKWNAKDFSGYVKNTALRSKTASLCLPYSYIKNSCRPGTKYIRVNQQKIRFGEGSLPTFTSKLAQQKSASLARSRPSGHKPNDLSEQVSGEEASALSRQRPGLRFAGYREVFRYLAL
jgi:hypothetical protein